MENILTLSDICCYLPYGLKMCHKINWHEKDWSKSETEDLILSQLCQSNYANNMFYIGGFDVNNKNRSVNYESTQFKPYLRPISSLTKEISVNGETFTPIKELFKMSLGEGLKREIDLSESEMFIKDDAINLKFKHFLFGYDTLDSSFCLVLNGEVMTPCNQAEMFDKLNEWFFDYKSNLISRGLALEIQE